MPFPTTRVVLYGFLSWLIPFLVSVPFYDRGGRPRIPIDLLKSMMVVVGAGVGAWLLVRLFERPLAIGNGGAVVGGLWLGMNVLLDLAVLVPLSKMPLPVYISQIALRYLTIPIMSIAIETVARRTPL
jgi:hypothetical protein